MKDRFPGPERSRRLAERFEGISTDSDNDGYGWSRKPFGSGFTGGAELRFLRTKHPRVFRSTSEALGRHWVRTMGWKPARDRRKDRR